MTPKPDAAAGVLLETVDVRKHFRVPDPAGRGSAALKAVDGVCLKVRPGEALGLVGESGCGKSTLGRLVLGLQRPTAGRIKFEGRDLDLREAGAARRFRRRMQIIFQDPFSSLNPRMNVGAILAEPFIIHGLARGKQAEEKAAGLLVRVGLSPDDRWRYPHEFSGGQRQRIGIARALALDPGLVVADEPVSSLDVSIQAQILNLLMDLGEERGIAYLFISHDLSIVRHISDRVAVMYLGRVVEEGRAEALYGRPLHPYTEALMAAIPSVEGARRKRSLLSGDIPSPVHPPAGCHFHPRCPIRGQGCDRVYPDLLPSSTGGLVACHYRS